MKDVARYYSRKTADILAKYGPGPKVHFHVGLFDDARPDHRTAALEDTRCRLVASQEALLERADTVWRVADHPPAELLDIGAGLGGGSIYWAQRYGTGVTALTNTAEHVPLIRDFAGQAQVGGLVKPVLGDIHTLDLVDAYDAVVAVESSGYMHRQRLFEVAARALRPAGWFGIVDHVLRDMRLAALIDPYYKTRLGTLDEYLTAADGAGFRLARDENVTPAVVGFWTESMSWTARALDDGDPPVPRDRLATSLAMHRRFVDIWRNQDVQTRLLLFCRDGV